MEPEKNGEVMEVENTNHVLPPSLTAGDNISMTISTNSGIKRKNNIDDGNVSRDDRIKIIRKESKSSTSNSYFLKMLSDVIMSIPKCEIDPIQVDIGEPWVMITGQQVNSKTGNILNPCWFPVTLPSYWLSAVSILDTTDDTQDTIGFNRPFTKCRFTPLNNVAHEWTPIIMEILDALFNPNSVIMLSNFTRARSSGFRGQDVVEFFQFNFTTKDSRGSLLYIGLACYLELQAYLSKYAFDNSWIAAGSALTSNANIASVGDQWSKMNFSPVYPTNPNLGALTNIFCVNSSLSYYIQNIHLKYIKTSDVGAPNQLLTPIFVPSNLSFVSLCTYIMLYIGYPVWIATISDNVSGFITGQTNKWNSYPLAGHTLGWIPIAHLNDMSPGHNFRISAQGGLSPIWIWIVFCDQHEDRVRTDNAFGTYSATSFDTLDLFGIPNTGNVITMAQTLAQQFDLLSFVNTFNTEMWVQNVQNVWGWWANTIATTEEMEQCLRIGADLCTRVPPPNGIYMPLGTHQSPFNWSFYDPIHNGHVINTGLDLYYNELTANLITTHQVSNLFLTPSYIKTWDAYSAQEIYNNQGLKISHDICAFDTSLIVCACNKWYKNTNETWIKPSELWGVAKQYQYKMTVAGDMIMQYYWGFSYDEFILLNTGVENYNQLDLFLNLTWSTIGCNLGRHVTSTFAQYTMQTDGTPCARVHPGGLECWSKMCNRFDYEIENTQRWLTQTLTINNLLTPCFMLPLDIKNDNEDFWTTVFWYAIHQGGDMYFYGSQYNAIDNGSYRPLVPIGVFCEMDRFNQQTPDSAVRDWWIDVPCIPHMPRWRFFNSAMAISNMVLTNNSLLRSANDQMMFAPVGTNYYVIRQQFMKVFSVPSGATMFTNIYNEPPPFY